MSRRHPHRHVFLDLNNQEPVDEVHPSTIVDSEISKRLEGVSLQQQTKLAQPAGSQGNTPTMLDIGGHSREVIPLVPDERIMAQRHAPSIFKTFEDAKPPPVDIQYEVLDQGVASPFVLRASMYNVPSTANLRERTNLPLGVSTCPFSVPDVPVADFADFSDVPRCARCRCYMNSAMQFIDGGVSFVCNMCQFVNTTPDDYFQPIYVDGRRVDWQERPELASGTYDLELPAIYGEQKAPLRHIFVLEVTREAIVKNITAVACSAILQAVSLLGDRNVTVITFSDKVHSYRLRDEGNIEMLVQADRAEFAFPPDIWTKASSPGFQGLLENIPSLFEDTPVSHSCYGSALSAALEISGDDPSRVTVFAVTKPSLPPGTLTRRDNTTLGPPGDLFGPEKELFQATSPFYTALADNYVKKGIGCDMFVFPSTSIDLANFGIVTERSGGAHFVYPRFVAARDERRFIANVLDICAEHTVATQAELIIRTSTGLQVENYWPKGLTFFGSKTTVAAQFVHDGKLDPKLDAHFQVAVLHTGQDGVRRVRVCNLVAGVTDKFKNVIKFVDTDTVMTLVSRQALSKLPELPINDIRKGIFDKIKRVFGACRLHAGAGMPLSQLLMPTTLRQLLPLSLALSKSLVLGERMYTSDSRVSNARRLSTLPSSLLSLALYPRIYPLHELAFEGLSDDQLLVEGARTRARQSDFHAGGAYLVWALDVFYLFLSKDCVPDMVKDLFGVETLGDISPYVDEIPKLNTEINLTARKLCEMLARRVGRSWVPLQIVREERDGAEYALRSLMVEEGYQEFVSDVHRFAKTYEEEKHWF